MGKKDREQFFSHMESVILPGSVTSVWSWFSRCMYILAPQLVAALLENNINCEISKSQGDKEKRTRVTFVFSTMYVK